MIHVHGWRLASPSTSPGGSHELSRTIPLRRKMPASPETPTWKLDSLPFLFPFRLGIPEVVGLATSSFRIIILCALQETSSMYQGCFFFLLFHYRLSIRELRSHFTNLLVEPYEYKGSSRTTTITGLVHLSAKLQRPPHPLTTLLLPT